MATNSVNEADTTINVCAEITSLPAGGLATEVVVTLSTTEDLKAGLQRTTDAVDNIITFWMTQHRLFADYSSVT